MKGKIKFVDNKSGKWGFLIPDEGGEDVHFYVSEFTGHKPAPGDAGLPVEFDLDTSGGKRSAQSPKLLQPRRTPGLPSIQPGEQLTRWAFVPFIPFRHQDGIDYSSATDLLAKMALRERWHFGSEPDPRNSQPILNYLKYTFYRLEKQGKIMEYKSTSDTWATFNTGLVDQLYDPIYALFNANRRPDPKWKFYDLCVPGKGPSGKQLTAVFDPLPEQATYFGSNFDMLLDTDKDVHVDYEHVILDGVRRNRFPQMFLERHVPKGCTWQDSRALDFKARRDFLECLSVAIMQDMQCMRSIQNRLEDATVLAEKRTRWNFKTAIPQYYPRLDIMSLLLPLAIVDDEKVDIALIVTRNPSGSYQGRTVLPLPWAYQNARLVCRPDSDWLMPELKSPEETLTDEDNSTEYKGQEHRTMEST